MDLIPRNQINLFDEHELELLIGGSTEIDVYVFPSALSLSDHFVKVLS